MRTTDEIGTYNDCLDTNTFETGYKIRQEFSLGILAEEWLKKVIIVVGLADSG